MLGLKRENLKKQKQKRNKTKEKQKNPVSVWTSQKCSSFEISCQINFKIVVCFGVDLT